MPPQVETEWLVGLAQRVGEQALPIFFAGLLLAVGCVIAFWWAWKRPQWQRWWRLQDSPQPLRQIGLRLMAGFVLIVLVSVLFAQLSHGIQAPGMLGHADQALTDALRANVPLAAVRFFAVLTHLGDTATLTGLTIVVALVLWAARQRVLAAGWVMAVAGNSLLNTVLKQVFARARPLQEDSLWLVDGYSFPSGHSSGSLVAYGMLAYLSARLLPVRWHLPALLGATLLACSVAASRIFLRVHFASDVLAGMASGAAWLAICIVSIDTMRWWRSPRS